MIEHFFLMIFCCTYTSVYRKSSKDLLFIPFFLIFLYAALRYHYGIDYYGYEDMFINLKNNIEPGNIEPGFIFILSCFKHFYQFIAFTSFLFCFCFYILLKRYVSKEFYSLFFVFFFIEPSLILNNFVAMRSAICVCIFIISLFFVVKRNFLIYSLLILFASLFHSSSLILLPFYFVPKIHFSSKYSFIYCCIACILLFSSYFFVNIIMDLFISEIAIFDRYTSFYEVSSLSFLGIVTRIHYPIIIYLLIDKLRLLNSDQRCLAKIAIVGIVFMMISIDPNERINMYLWPVILVSLFYTFRFLKQTVKIPLILYMIAYSSYSLYNLYSASYGVSFIQYKTVFSATILP